MFHSGSSKLAHCVSYAQRHPAKARMCGGLGCWGWHRRNYREFLVMFLCLGFRSQFQGSICGSLRSPVVWSIGRVFGLGFLTAVPGVDAFCNPLTGSPGLGCWGWHRGNYRELLVMFLCWGFQRQSQGSICGSLHHHLFVIWVVLGVFANRVQKAGRKTRKRFGDFPILRNVR